LRRKQAIDGRKLRKKRVCKNKNQSRVAGLKFRQLPCSFAGEVGKEQFLNEKREESFSSFSAFPFVAAAAASAAAASGTNKF
jgi:hypothetical protein